MNKGFSLKDMTEEYVKGMRNVISFLREEGIICKREDNCGECNKIDIFLSKRIKESL